MPKDLKAGFEQAKAQAHTQGPSEFPLLGSHLLERKGQVIDLSRPIFNGMPMWFGHQKMFIVTNQDWDGWRRVHKTDAGFYARNLIMSEHTGTHTDGINEYDETGPALDEVPLSYYWGDAVVLDMSHVKFVDPDPDGQGYATEEDIKLAEAKLAEHGEEIREGDICILWFDCGDRLFPDQKFLEEYPGVSWDGAEYLAKKGVVNIGTDCVGIDNPLDVMFSGHMVCKKYGIVNTENLSNLDKIVNKRVLFFGLPLPIQGGTGSPIRAFAYVQD